MHKERKKYKAGQRERESGSGKRKKESERSEKEKREWGEKMDSIIFLILILIVKK